MRSDETQNWPSKISLHLLEANVTLHVLVRRVCVLCEAVTGEGSIRALCLIHTMVHLDTSLFFSGAILLTVHCRLVSGRMLVDDVVKGGRIRGTRDPAEALRHVKHGTGSCQVGFAIVLVVKSGSH